ncbi:hypothetical protein ACOMHN_019136 [Nucella lapillus]
MSGNHGNVWKLAEVTVPRDMPGPAATPPAGLGASASAPVQIYLRATRGQGIYGDIAIDDVSSLPGVCTPERLDCSFEADEGLCLWIQGDSGVTLQWCIHSGPTATLGTGPDSALHSVNDDNHAYLYLEADDGGSGEVGEVVSPSLFLPSPLCLRFWYHMEGTGVHSLAVLLRRKGSNSETLLWQRLGSQHTTTWLHAHVTLHTDHPHTAHRAVIQAIRGRSPIGDIAIDLISVTSGACGGGTFPINFSRHG